MAFVEYIVGREMSLSLVSSSRIIPAFVLVVILAMVPCSLGQADEPHRATFGTLIIAIGNANGIVVMTDSMASNVGADGRIYQLADPHQKLLRYSDRIVCAIAGLGTVSVPVDPRLNASLLGIIEAYRDSVQKQNVKESIDSAMMHISASIRLYIASIAELDDKTGQPIPNSHFEMIMAGYDVDDRPKIGRLDLEVSKNTVGETPAWVANETGREVNPLVQQKMLFQRGGIAEVAEDLFQHPERYPLVLRAVGIYLTAAQNDLAWTMPLPDVVELERLMIELTAIKHPEVGNGFQTAVLQSGKTLQIDQRSFPPLKRPMAFSFFYRIDIAPGGIVLRNIVGFYEASRIHGIENATRQQQFFQTLQLDNSIFVNCELSNMLMYYDGGNLYIDDSDRFYNVDFMPGPNAARRRDMIRRLYEISAKSKAKHN